MRTTLAGAALLTSVLLGTLSNVAAAQEQPSDPHFGPAELAERTLQRRAVEAVIWGMPAVNYDLMLQEMLGKTAGRWARSSTGAVRSTRRTRRSRRIPTRSTS